MRRTMMKSKIHRATVTQADLDYEGSVTIDEDLMDAARITQGKLELRRQRVGRVSMRFGSSICSPVPWWSPDCSGSTPKITSSW